MVCAQTLPDSLRTKVVVKVVGHEALVGHTQQLFQLHLISAGARIEQEMPGWILDIRVTTSETAPAWVALSMIMARQEKPRKRMSTSELESGAWIQDYVMREMVDPRRIHHHEVVLVPETELEAAVLALVERFSEEAIEPMRRFWLERQNRE